MPRCMPRISARPGDSAALIVPTWRLEDSVHSDILNIVVVSPDAKQP
jgi:hypothetical protein